MLRTQSDILLLLVIIFYLRVTVVGELKTRNSQNHDLGPHKYPNCQINDLDRAAPAISSSRDRSADSTRHPALSEIFGPSRNGGLFNQKPWLRFHPLRP